MPFIRKFINDQFRSICTKCYRTAGESIFESSLAEQENHHQCDWSDLLRLKSYEFQPPWGRRENA